MYREAHSIGRILLLTVFLWLGTAKAGQIGSGYWVKLKVTEAGVYKIDFQDLKSFGFDVAGTDPRQIKLIGHQGGMLPEKNGMHVAGMPEIPILISGESDGVFDPQDFILFYSGGLHKWKFNSSNAKFQHISNIYSNEAFLYLGVTAGLGLRIKTRQSVTQNPDQLISKYTWLSFHDSDIYNPVAMGRTWIGEKMGNETLLRNFSVNLPQGCSDSAWVQMSFAGGMKDASGSVITTINGISQQTNFGQLNEEFEGFRLTQRGEWVYTGGTSVAIKLELVRPNSQSSGWMDYYEINAPRNIPNGENAIIRSPEYALSGVSETRIPGAGSQVWDVTNELIPVEISIQSGSGFEYFRTENTTGSSAFAVFNLASCRKPGLAGVVSNQDILSGDAAELIIISHPKFIKQAQELAAFRRSNDKLKVTVVEPQSIYNEFSTGQQDIVAIRDYLKAQYYRGLQSGDTLKYVLLFGSTSYDPKDRVANNTNYIPIYQSPSIYKSQTFCLDDFYGYFDSTGGVPGAGKNSMWISVGRLPVRTEAEAQGIVNKLKRYSSAEALGPWRSDISFISDDVDENWESEFVRESEKYASVIEKTHPDLLVNKIYADAFKQQSTGNTEKYPGVSDAIDRTMAKGSLFVNYQGHGGEKGWAQEAILTVPMINNWSNSKFMPVLFTATCEFSRFDDPSLQSGGELALLNPNGGAIALMSTTRLVFVSGNSQINYDFWTNYGFPKPNEPVPTVGDLYKKMKNRPFTTSEDNKFALLGDPSMTMAFPEHKVVLDSINGVSAETFSDTVKAFAVVKIKGHIRKRLGGKFNDFNGQLWVRVFDKPQLRYTLDNDNNGAKTAFRDENSYIFKGTVSITKGEFQVTFPVPKDISYVVDSARMAFYAHNGAEDASGAFKVLLGGSLDQIQTDNKGPDITLYMNDSSFVYGGNVQTDAILIARVSDKSGLNTTGAGIGRDMTAILDPGTADEQQFIVNDFFNYELNSYTTGSVIFPFKDLAKGDHYLQFKAWDIHNNSSESVIKFSVLPEDAFVVTEHSEVPNPFREEVEFRFTHNLAGENLKAILIVMDQTGRKLFENGFQLDNSTTEEHRIKWDGYDHNRRFCNPGFYFYRLELIAEDGRTTMFDGRIIKH